MVIPVKVDMETATDSEKMRPVSEVSRPGMDDKGIEASPGTLMLSNGQYWNPMIGCSEVEIELTLVFVKSKKMVAEPWPFTLSQALIPMILWYVTDRVGKRVLKNEQALTRVARIGRNGARL